MKKVLCIVGCFCLAAVLFASVTVIPCTADGGPDPWAISSHSQPPQFSGDGKSLAWQAKIGAVMDLPSWAQILLLVLVIVLVLGMAAFLILRHARLRFRRLSEEITGREHATRALREFEEQFRTVVERARDGVCIIQDRLIKLANRRLAEMLGRTVEEITNTSFVHYIHPDELPVIIDRYERRMRGEDVPSLYETKLLHSKGHTVYVELSIGIATYGGRAAELVIVRDITGRKKAEEIILEHERFITELTENAPHAIVVINPDTSIRYVNPIWEEINGWKREEVIGLKAPYPWWPDEIKEEAMRNFPLSMMQKGSAEIIAQKKNGEKYWIAMSWVPVMEGDRLKYLLVNSVDITERRKMEEMLRQSEENFRRSVDESPLGIAVVTDEGDIIYANRTLLNIYGFADIEELRATPISKRYTPQSYEEFRIRRERRNRGEFVSPDYSISIVRKDGQVRHLEVHRRELLWNGEKRLLVLYNDVTERRNAEEQRSHLESLLRAIRNVNQLITRERDRKRLLDGCCQILKEVREHQAVCIALIDSTGKAYMVSAAGLGEELTLLEKRLSEGNLPHCMRLALARAHPVFTNAGLNPDCEGCPFYSVHQHQGRIIARLSHEGKTYGTISIIGEEKFLGSVEGLSLVQEVASDIAFAINTMEMEEARREALLALQQAEAKFRDLYENAPVPYYSVDINGVIRQCNRMAHQWLGYEDGELIGKHRLVLYAEESMEKAKEVFERFKRGETVHDEELVFIRKNGERLYGLLTMTAIRDDNGQIIGNRGVVKDITERRRLMQQLMMQDRLAALGELVSGVAHEINNPLTGVIGLSEMLLKEDLPEEVRNDIQVILEESRRIAGIVRNLLTFARKQPMEKSLVDVNQVMQRVLDLRAYEQKVNNISVVARLAPDLPHIQANASQLQQVFLNLVLNAEYFMKEAHGRGTLTVTTESLGDFVRISIADDGPGISEENMRHLFNPFFTTKPHGKGTGLGLSISRGIVEEHGGRIYAESQLGKGATFFVELPIGK